MAINYGDLSDEALLTALEYADMEPHPALIRACVERRQALTPGLLAMLRQAPQTLMQGLMERWDRRDPRRLRTINAAVLLIEFRELAALPILAEYFRHKAYDTMHLWLQFYLGAYGPPIIPLMLELLKDETAYVSGRVAAAYVLGEIAWNHPHERARVLEAFYAQLPSLTDEGLRFPDGTIYRRRDYVDDSRCENCPCHLFSEHCCDDCIDEYCYENFDQVELWTELVHNLARLN